MELQRNRLITGSIYVGYKSLLLLRQAASLVGEHYCSNL
jgi:hypothetical protein